jgi:hypothetical protein
MDATAEVPAKPRLAHAFTTENAAEMCRRGVKTRLENLARLKREAELGRSALRATDATTVVLFAEMNRILEQMASTEDATDKQRLSAAYARIFSAWQVLTATPNPGSRRIRSRQPGLSDLPQVTSSPAR